MINKTTFFLEYYMINRTNYITDALKSNIYYLSNNQGITLPHKNNVVLLIMLYSLVCMVDVNHVMHQKKRGVVNHDF